MGTVSTGTQSQQPKMNGAFPMTAEDVAAAVVVRSIGGDLSRDDMKETPRRMVKALLEMTEGRDQDAAAILGKTFDVTCDEMVVVTGIPFVSLCEHHVLPFTGTATVGYIPGARVVGLSKIPRVVECFAKRLQVQERLTQQIAAAIDDVLKPHGVGVVITADHTCMQLRGVKCAGSMTTSHLIGRMKEDAATRAEFLGFRQQ